MREILSDNGRWIAHGELSEIDKMLAEDPKVEDDSECLICKVGFQATVPAVVHVLANTWLGLGEEGIIKIAVCRRHHTHWTFVPNEGLITFNAQYRGNPN